MTVNPIDQEVCNIKFQINYLKTFKDSFSTSNEFTHFLMEILNQENNNTQNIIILDKCLNFNLNFLSI